MAEVLSSKGGDGNRDDAERGHGDAFGFWAITLAFVVVFAASSIPIPLYATLQAAHPGITDAHVSLTMFVYLVGVVAMLLFSGKLSDAVGRKAPTVAALAISAASDALFLAVDSAWLLLAVRLMQGISCGLGMGPVSAYIIDLAGTRLSVFARTVVGTFPMLGLTVGSLGLGAWMLATPDYRPLFWAFVVAQIALAFVALAVRETVPAQERIPLASVFRSPVAFPPGIRHVFPFVFLAYASTWCMQTYFESFSSLVAADAFGDEGTLLASVILMLAMLPSCAGGVAEARLRMGASLRVGMGLFMLSLLGMCLALWARLLPAFLVSVAAMSFAAGMSLAGGLRVLYAADPDAPSSAIISIINLTAYIACGVVNVGMSAGVGALGLSGTLFALSGGCALCGAACIPLSKRSLRA